MSEAFGWSRTAVSGPYSLRTVIAGLMGPLAGISINKFGPRRNIILGNIVLAIGLACMFLISDIWQVYLFFSVLGGMGMTFGFFIATATIVNNWFIKRRSLAMSLLVVSGGIGGFVYPPLIAWVISSLGWRLAWVCLAIIQLVLAVGVGGMLVRNRPEDIGQVPDGKVTDKTDEARVSKQAPMRVYQTPVDWKVKEALRTRTYWLMIIFLGAPFFAGTALSTHQVVYLQSLGFSPMTAATSFGVLLGVSIVGRLAIGALGTRFEASHLAAACLAVFAIGIIILMNVKTLPLIYLYVLLGGIGYGGITTLDPTIYGAYYGRAHYAEIMGWRIPFMTLITAAGPIVPGFIYDHTGSYILAFTVVAAMLGVGLVCALLARPPKPQMTISQ